MQPLIKYLLGETHPDGQRLADSQTCLRAQDIDEVGDNRHTTFFEMLGNWSLGDYFKSDQLAWFFEFLIDRVGLEPERLYVSCFLGDKANNLPKDLESGKIWSDLFASKQIDHKAVDIGSAAAGYKNGMQDGRIFYYDATKNWWSRFDTPSTMPEGEPGGPDSEVFYDFGLPHDTSYGAMCHPNCECGRFLEIGNSVFMEYVKTKNGFDRLPNRNVDFGGGLERIAAASLQDPDIFNISLLKPIITKLETISNQTYDSHTKSMRVIADHLRAAVFLAVDGVVPSNKSQGYVMRRLLRRAIRFALDLGVDQALCKQLLPVIIDIYHADFPELAQQASKVVEVLTHEEQLFRQTLRAGVREFNKLAKNGLNGDAIFKLYDTYGFPVELTKEEALSRGIDIQSTADHDFQRLMDDQRLRSRTASKGEFKGGLIDHSQIVLKYHTATHLMYKALRIVLGEHVVQRGSNITTERLRFDFSHPSKLTEQQVSEVEQIVNQQIAKNWPMHWRQENTHQALADGVMGAFGDRYGETVKIYTVGDPDGIYYSQEICGGPHVEHTNQLAEEGKKFKIIKEESSSAGIRRIKAVLQ